MHASRACSRCTFRTAFSTRPRSIRTRDACAIRSHDDDASMDSGERRGNVLDVARELVAEGRGDAILELVAKLDAHNRDLAVRAARVDELATRNVELEKQLDKLLARVKKSETVSTAQLVLFADAIRRGEAGDVLADGDPRGDANDRLR